MDPPPTPSNTMDVAAWLRELGLGRYETLFRENDIATDILLELTADDLKEIGVVSVGDRRRFIAAIDVLKKGSGQATVHASTFPANLPSPAGAECDFEAAGGAERRQVTVLFCDLANSTALSASVDPEDLREIIASYHRAVSEEIRRAGGYVAKFLGDGVLAYFGWPEAHEDDAERAVRAGLAAAETVAQLKAPDGNPLAARVGIATGLVVVGEVLGEGEARERGIVGETPNLAARLQALAKPGEVFLDGPTRRNAGGLFDFVDLGDVQIKGIPNQIRAWRALGESKIESRFAALRAASGKLPVLGREEEIELLLRRWREAVAGQGRVVPLRGEAGIGKSRLVAALQEALADEEHEELVFYCLPQHAGSALRPIIARIERAAGLTAGDPPEVRLAKLEALLTPLSPPPEDVALIAELLSIPTMGRWPAVELAPQRRRERMLAALLRRVRALATRRPVLAIVEDMHWVDPTTQELLDLLVAETPDISLLLLITHRPDFDAGSWLGLPHVVPVQLNQLRPAQQAALLHRVAGAKKLPPEIESEILARTDGVPLFVEEVGRAVLESGLLREEADRWVLEGPLPTALVPTTLQASLVARLDRLSSARGVAQAGAVIGREFAHDLLTAVLDLPDPTVSEALSRLVAADLVQRRGSPPDAVYTFKHALVQDAAYGTLLRERRQFLHQSTAQALEKLRPDYVEREPQILAHHYEMARMPLSAIRFSMKAAELALGRAAHLEAKSGLLHAIDLLAAVVDVGERARLEADLKWLLGQVFFAVKGYAATEAGDALRSALAAAEQASASDRRFVTLASLWTHLQVTGRCREAHDAGTRMLTEAEQRGDSSHLLVGHYMSGVSVMSLGCPTEARRHFEAGTSVGDRAAASEHVFAPGHSAAIGVRMFLCEVLVILGNLDRAVSVARQCIDMARTANHSLTLAAALSTVSRSLLRVWADTTVVNWSVEGAALAEEKGFVFYQATGKVRTGWINAKQGEPSQGAALALEGLREYIDTGARWNVPVFSLFASEAQEEAGFYDEALHTVSAALELIEVTEETGQILAELLRARGNLLARSGATIDAEDNFAQALDVARRQGAKMWELRASISLARLLCGRGRHSSARGLLNPIFQSFPADSLSAPMLLEISSLIEE